MNLGGGIYVVNAKLSIDASTIAGNVSSDPEFSEAISFGGGIYNGGTVWMTNSAVVENVLLSRVGDGGGIVNGGQMFIADSTIGGNSASSRGGGVFNSGKLALQGVTIADNGAHGAFKDVPSPEFPPGCHIDEDSGEPSPECLGGGSSLWNEPIGTIRIAQSLIGNDCRGVLITEGHNALTDALTDQCTLQPSPRLHGGDTHDQVNVDPRLGVLQDDGEPGNAHYPLLADSPLIDAGGRIGKNCTPRDQIGQHRVEGDNDHDKGRICDVGAIEFQPFKKHGKQ